MRCRCSAPCVTSTTARTVHAQYRYRSHKDNNDNHQLNGQQYNITNITYLHMHDSYAIIKRSRRICYIYIEAYSGSY